MELFYKQGYRATGINEVIQKSGVAKATFYNHFPAKDDLGRAYLESMRESELAYMENAIGSQKQPIKRWLAVVESLGPWLEETNFRGCPFMNMASEVPDFADPMRKEGQKLYDEIRGRIIQLTKELIASDETKYAHLDVEELSKQYLIIFVGAVGLAELYHAIWPVEQALHSVRRLLN